MAGFDKAAVKFLGTPVGDSELLPLAEKVVEALRGATHETEQLRRYRQTRKRMPARPTFSLRPPGFMYTVHST